MLEKGHGRGFEESEEESVCTLTCTRRETARHVLEIAFCLVALQLEDTWLMCTQYASFPLQMARLVGLLVLFGYAIRSILHLVEIRRRPRDSLYHTEFRLQGKRFVALRWRVQTRAFLLLGVALLHATAAILLSRNCVCLENHDLHHADWGDALFQLQTLETACSWLDNVSICGLLTAYHAFSTTFLVFDLFLLSLAVDREYQSIKR